MLDGAEVNGQYPGHNRGSFPFFDVGASSAHQSLHNDDGRDSGSTEDECREQATDPGTGTGIVHRVESLVIRLARRPERERRDAATGGAAIDLYSHREDGERGGDDQKTCPDEDAEYSDAAAGRAGGRLIHDAQGSTIALAVSASAEQRHLHP